LKILVQDLGKHVAISEEYANDPSQRIKSGGLLFDRRVTRIITPGTLIDEKFMDPLENNYLLSIHADPTYGHSKTEPSRTPESVDSLRKSQRQDVGLAWLDLSSGDFFTQKTDMVSLPSVIARIGPREVIINSAFQNLEHSRIVSLLKDGRHSMSYHQPAGTMNKITDWAPMLEDTVAALEPTKFTEEEVAAGTFLLQYVNTQLQGNKAQLQAPVQRHDEEFMMIDKHSLRALEVKSTLRDGNLEGSLLHAVRRTVTKSGARLLSQRLCEFSLSCFSAAL
jgi:DNA mismatch repair ATPase MutS